MGEPGAAPASSLGEVAAVFLRLGCTAFGGPAAHIALMREELVRRRRWVSDQEFLDLLGATNLIPGPNSTEMAIALGYVRAGWRGLLVAGALFILPATVLVLALAAIYVAYGGTPTARWLLYGVQPVLLAIIAQALVSLARTAARTLPLAALGLAVFILYFLGVNELALLFGAGALALLVAGVRLRARPRLPLALALPGLGAPVVLAAAPISLGVLFFSMLKIGAVLYGSGYVLIAFLRNEFVRGLGWITDRQLLDAVAVGQLTPGPLFTTATFVGYLVAGVPGALLATAAIFLPSFAYVAALHPLLPRLRTLPLVRAALDGVNVAALGLIAAVSVQLGRAALVDGLTVALAALALFVLLRWRPNSVYLMVGGAAVGLAAHVLRLV